jgi:hypothetical protein
MTLDSPQSEVAVNLPPFKNERIFPGVDDPTVREAFPQVLAKVRGRLGMTCRLHINGQDVATDRTLDSVNPADPDEVVGKVFQAGTAEAEQALVAAERALLSWRDVEPSERAGYLVKAAAVARRNLFEYAAWQVLEEGKQWAQAYNDLTEGIDFLEYYAREMIRLLSAQGRSGRHRPMELPLCHFVWHVRGGHRHGQSRRLQAVEPISSSRASPGGDLPRGRFAERCVQLRAGAGLGHR